MGRHPTMTKRKHALLLESLSALCLPRAPVEERRTPVLSRCSPNRCLNSCITTRQFPPWEALIADDDLLLRDTHLSALQREAVEAEQTRKRRLIAPLTAARI